MRTITKKTQELLGHVGTNDVHESHDRASITGIRLLLAMVFMGSNLHPCFPQTTFQKKLDLLLPSPQLCTSADGSAFYLADAFVGSGLNRLHVLKLDAQGNVLWHYTHAGTDLNRQLKTLQVVQDGVILLLNSYHNDQKSNSYIIKFDLDGNVLWERRLGVENFTQLFDIQEDPDRNLWVSGLHLQTNANDSSYHFLSKMDPNAVPLLSKQAYFRYFPNTDFEACRFTDLTWDRLNNTLVFVEDFANPFSQSGISSPNRNRSSLGFCDPLFDLDERLTGYNFNTLEATDSTLIFGGRVSLGNFLPGDPGIGILDKTGKKPLVVKRTATEFQPIPSHSGDIVFYVPETKLLIKFDRSLSPIWTIKLDNCSDTHAFDADIAADGTIYVVRDLDDKTVIAKVLPDGSMPACTTYHRPPPELMDDLALESYGYNPHGYPEVPFSETAHTFGFTAAASSSADFCVKIDASFTVPDTICLGMEVLPGAVDTTTGLQHTWDMGDFRSEDMIPEIPFPGTGPFTILHRVENGICMDMASHLVQVISRPDIPFGDTLVCGPASLTIDFSGQNATEVYLNDVPTGPIFRIEQVGTFNIRLQNPGCAVEKEIQVNIVTFPPPILPLDSTYCYGDTVKVSIGADFGQVQWDNVATSDSFVILDGAAHSYQAVYEPDTLCVVSGTFNVPRKDCDFNEKAIYVPNVFSPGSEGENGLLKVFPKPAVRIKSMQLFDRWGNMLYSHQGDNPEWNGVSADGQACMPGVYTYWIEYQDERKAGTQVLAGDVLLVR